MKANCQKPEHLFCFFFCSCSLCRLVLIQQEDILGIYELFSSNFRTASICLFEAWSSSLLVF